MRKENAQRDALDLLEKLASQFPGVIDGDTKINDLDLVAWLTKEIADKESLNIYLSVYTIDPAMSD